MSRPQALNPVSRVFLLILLIFPFSGEAFVSVCAIAPVAGRRTYSRTRTRCAGYAFEGAERGWGGIASLKQMEAPPVLSVPVFSLATLNEDGSTNMNVVTYASPVGIEPERLWMISLYQNTLSYDNFMREGWGVLQFLRTEHASLVTILGKNSGKDIDKALRSGEEGFVWEELPSEVLGAPRTVAIVPGCTAYMNLQLVRKQSAGDHDVVVCRVLGAAGPARGEEIPDSHGATMLYTRYLRELSII